MKQKIIVCSICGLPKSVHSKSNPTRPNHDFKPPLQKKKFTVKQWKKLRPEIQQAALKQFDVILTDHETKKEKLIRYGKAINFENFDKNMKRFDKGMKVFNKVMNDFDTGMKKGLGTNKRSSIDSIWGSKPKNKKSKKQKPKKDSPADKIWGKSKSNPLGKRKVKVF